MKIKEKIRAICLLLSAILAVSIAIPAQPGAAAAEDQAEASGQSAGEDGNSLSEPEAVSELKVLIANIEETAEEADRDAFAVSGLRVTISQEPQANGETAKDTVTGQEDNKLQKRALDDTAQIVSAEGKTWEIPVFWVNGDRKLVKSGVPGQDCTPVLAFFLPEEYRVSDGTEQGFTVTLDHCLSSLFEKAGGAVCVYEPKTKITYILAGEMDLSFLEEADEEEEDRKLPKPIPGLTDEEDRTPDTDGAGQSGTVQPQDNTEAENESEPEPEPEPEPNPEPEQEPEDSLDLEKLLGHCADNTIEYYGEDEVASFVDLIINCIQPQAVNLIRTKFPTFAAAADEGGLGQEIGLYVYRNRRDTGDTTLSHKNASSDACAYSDSRVALNKEKDAYQLEYLIGINTKFFETVDEDGTYHIDVSEESLTDLDHTLVHEMLHVFMFDHNRTGATGMTDISTFVINTHKYLKECGINKFPGWFEEGLASSVEYNYKLRYDTFKLLRYEDEGVIGTRHTAENLLKAYVTKTFVLGDGETYADNYDLEDPYEDVTSCYTTGYLADLYLGEMAAKSAGLGTSVTVDEEGNRKVSSETIRLGLDSILDRLHNGECLDKIICSISGGIYQDTEDFAAKFIKGDKGTGDEYSGDEDSIGFVVDFLNYMQDIENESGQIPNGSVLFDFDEDFSSPVDRSAAVEENIYQINDSDDYVFSTVWIEAPHTDAGKSSASAGAAVLSSGSEAAQGTDDTQNEQDGDGSLKAARISGIEPEVIQETEGSAAVPAEEVPVAEEPAAEVSEGSEQEGCGVISEGSEQESIGETLEESEQKSSGETEESGEQPESEKTEQ